MNFFFSNRGSYLKSISAIVQHLRKSTSIKSYRQKFHRLKSTLAKDNDNKSFGSNDLSEFLLSKKTNIIRKLSNGKEDNFFRYSSLPDRGGQINYEQFTFIPRDYESTEIINYMVRRQTERMTYNSQDKMTNPVIVITGSSGIGKSTFLSHFPESSQYKEYISNRSPIVSTLTFNSVMNSGDDLFELRIIYGSIISMGLINNIEYPWTAFHKQFENSKLSITSTIKLLQLLFGKDRPILILVDELSKTNEPADIMKKIGILLGNHGYVDVIVSSLSPNFVESIMSLSLNFRPVNYTVITPLLNSEIGKKECEDWIDNLVKRLPKGEIVDKYKVNLARIAYLLYSGHPRSIECLVNELQTRKDWSVLEKTIKSSVQFGEFLNVIISLLPTYQADLSDISKEQMENIIFRHPICFSVSNSDFKNLLENGKIMINNQSFNDRFITCVQLKSIFDLIQCDSLSKYKDDESRCGAAHFFLNDIFTLDKLSRIWERFVLLNIVMRSYEDLSISEIFGIDFISSDNKSIARKLKFGKNAELFPNSDKLIYSLDYNQSSNNGLVILKNKKDNQIFLFYLQIKITVSKDDIKKVVIKMIINNLLEYLRNNNNDNMISLENVNMIMYIGECEKDLFDIFLKNKYNKFIKIKDKKLMEIIVEIFELLRKNEKSLPLKFNEEFVLSFLINNFNQVHFVGKDIMKDWLSPSFLPFSMIASATEDEVQR